MNSNKVYCSCCLCLITSLNLQDWTNIATIVGVLTGLGLLYYTARQLQKSTQISKGEFLLDLEKMSNLYNDVHKKLRPNGIWTKGESGPITAEEWVEVEDYMGFFEHCEMLIRDKSIDADTFEKIFGYRVNNIVKNKVIYTAKLIEKREKWALFVSLLKRLKIPEQKSQ